MGSRRTHVITLVSLLAGCASGPQPPDWQQGARGALDLAVAAELRAGHEDVLLGG